MVEIFAGISPERKRHLSNYVDMVLMTRGDLRRSLELLMEFTKRLTEEEKDFVSFCLAVRRTEGEAR